MQGIIREIRAGESTATIRIQFGESIVESIVANEVMDEMGIKVGDQVTAMFESTPVVIMK